jgi:lipopolysaccharide/colanic/teichoic acid biosynthesis glycosyltransferase
MFLVGPRPMQNTKTIASHASRYHVQTGSDGARAGTGWNLTFENERRVEHGSLYSTNWSLWLDVKIILRTVLVAGNLKVGTTSLIYACRLQRCG